MHVHFPLVMIIKVIKFLILNSKLKNMHVHLPLVMITNTKWRKLILMWCNCQIRQNQADINSFFLFIFCCFNNARKSKQNLFCDFCQRNLEEMYNHCTVRIYMKIKLVCFCHRINQSVEHDSAMSESQFI